MVFCCSGRYEFSICVPCALSLPCRQRNFQLCPFFSFLCAHKKKSNCAVFMFSFHCRQEIFSGVLFFPVFLSLETKKNRCIFFSFLCTQTNFRLCLLFLFSCFRVFVFTWKSITFLHVAFLQSSFVAFPF